MCAQRLESTFYTSVETGSLTGKDLRRGPGHSTPLRLVALPRRAQLGGSAIRLWMVTNTYFTHTEYAAF
jgi:hypothetical protein